MKKEEELCHCGEVATYYFEEEMYHEEGEGDHWCEKCLNK